MKKSDLIKAAINLLADSMHSIEVQDTEGEKQALARLEKLQAYAKKQPTRLTCDMSHDCQEPITHIDEKGFIYCATHGYNRRISGRKCRKLKPAEMTRLLSGLPLTKY